MEVVLGVEESERSSEEEEEGDELSVRVEDGRLPVKLSHSVILDGLCCGCDKREWRLSTEPRKRKE